MLKNQIKIRKIILFNLILIDILFALRGYPQGINKHYIPINYYITKPVKNDSKEDSPRDFEFSKETLDRFLANILKSNTELKYDSTMDFVTSFERQKNICFNSRYFGLLNYPDKCNLMDIYFNSGFDTQTMNGSIVQFIKTYKKTIFNFGTTTVFEYELIGVAEVEPHFIYILLKERTKDETRYGMDYKGFVICSDGMQWKLFGEGGVYLPLFIQRVNRSKEFYIPLYYYNDRFIPIGHFKTKNWHD